MTIIREPDELPGRALGNAPEETGKQRKSAGQEMAHCGGG